MGEDIISVAFFLTEHSMLHSDGDMICRQEQILSGKKEQDATARERNNLREKLKKLTQVSSIRSNSRLFQLERRNLELGAANEDLGQLQSSPFRVCVAEISFFVVFLKAPSMGKI